MTTRMFVRSNLVNFQEEVMPDSLGGALNSNISHDGPCLAVLTHNLQARVVKANSVCMRKLTDLK